MMGKGPDIVDWAAAAGFAFAGLLNGAWGVWVMMGLITIPIGILYLIVGALLWYAAKGVFSRDSEAWWSGALSVLVLTVTFPITGGLLFLLGSFPSLGVGLLLLAYLGLRSREYGVGVRRGTGNEPVRPLEKAR